MGGAKVLEEVKAQLGVEEHQTTKDGKFSLATEECLAGCDHAPCLLINERLHKRVRPEDVKKLLADADNAKLPMPRSDLFDAPRGGATKEPGGVDVDALIESTSDVREMRDA